MTALLEHLRARMQSGRKLLVPYLVAGLPEEPAFGAAFAAVAEHADVVEIGLPFSDPLMDGPVIAAAAERMIRAGVGPIRAIELAGGLEESGATPRVAMTYYNPIHHLGERDFCRRASAAGFAGLIVPDLPREEAAGLIAEAAAHDLAWIPLVAPTSSPDRVAAITEAATGFVYAVSTLGVTGARASLSERAASVVARCREATDLPVLVGIGVSTPEQAVEAARSADGVVMGSAVVTAVVEEGPAAASALLSEVRAALDTLP